jgi:hypothetical protein
MADEPAPAVKTLGTIVSEVITTALPAADKLFSLIWSKIKPENQNRPARPDDVKEAVTKAREDLSADIRRKVLDLQQIQIELSVLNDFLAPGIEASGRLQKINGILGNAKEATPEQLESAKNEWTDAKAAILRMKSEQLNQVKDRAIRFALTKIVSDQKALTDPIDAAFNRKDTGALRAGLMNLGGSVSDVATLVGIAVHDLASGLSEATKTLGGQGATTAMKGNEYVAYMKSRGLIEENK